jgi:hypothetical protein
MVEIGTSLVVPSNRFSPVLLIRSVVWNILATIT